MAEKKLKTRIQQKADTSANWGKATAFVPLKGEYIYYSDLHRVKVGDGVTKVGELPFLADNNTTYDASDGIKLDGNTFKHTNAVAAKSSGFYKVSYDAQGHITGSIAVTKADITNLGVPSADTHWTTHAYVGVKDQLSNAATSNGNTYLKVCDESTIGSQFNIKGVGATTVASDANGNITITSNDTHQEVVNKNPTLSWGGQSTVGTIGGTALTVTMPANPNWSSYLYVGAKDTAANKATNNGEAYLKLYENGALRSQFNIKGSGGTAVVTDSNGGIVISSPATTNKNATLAWGSAVTLATVGSTNITATLPTEPTVTMVDLR